MIAELSPERCILTIVDFQNDFCHEDGAIARLGQSTGGARDLVPALEALLEVARRASVPRVFVRVAHSEWTDAPAWRGRGAGGSILDVARMPVAREGTWGAEFYKLSPQENDFVITKHRYSAFAHTALQLVLQGREASTIVIAGVQTNVCVHATARDAVQLGFTPVVVEDCVAANSTVEHDVALADIKTRIGPVVSLDDVRDAWQGRPANYKISSPVHRP